MKERCVAYGGAIHTAYPAARRSARGRPRAADADVVWLPPFDVGTIIALGLNYSDHGRSCRKS